MKSLKALLFVATAMLVSGTSWAMGSKAAAASASTTSSTSSTAIVEYQPKADTLGMDLKVPATTQATGPNALDAKIAHIIQTASPQVRSKALQYAKNCTLYCLQLAKMLGLGTLDTIQSQLLSSLFQILYFSCHELGHAFMAKLVDSAHQKNVTVHLFCGAAFGMACTKPIIDWGFIKIHMDIFQASATIATPILDRTKNILFLLAGGSTGLLSQCLFLSGQTFAQKYTETKDLKKSAHFAITRAHTPFQNILEQKGLNKWQLFLKISFTTAALTLMLDQIFYTFTPIMTDGDGTKTWALLLGYNPNIAGLAENKEFCNSLAKQPLQLQQTLGFNFNNATQCPIDTMQCYKIMAENLIKPFEKLINDSIGKIISPELLFDAERELPNCYYCNHLKEFEAGPFRYVNYAPPILYLMLYGGILYIYIKGVNCFCSYVYNKPTTIFHVIWEKAIRPTAHIALEKVGRPIVWGKVLKTQVEALAAERRIINDFAHGVLNAPINTITDPEQYAPHPKAKTTLFMQAMYHCLRNKGSQAWSTIKGWFSCGKPKAA